MKKNNKKYALKEMSKVKIIERRSEKSIKGEREFLSRLHHPFIVNMACAFQDDENLYLVMDLLTGGDLRYHLCRLQKFSEEETKFFIACLLLGLEYIHGNNIIHRDIKPENLVCEENGYIRITDFGVAKIVKEENSSETSGTPGYMAPEVLFAQNHSFPVDFFAIGVMGYEFMNGERPYIGKSRKEIKHLVFKRQAKISYDEIPEGWTYESVDFINKCLKRKWSKRLGYNNGVAELKNHPWLKHFNWDKLYTKKKRAPFIPKKGCNYDKRYCEAIEKVNDTTRERYQNYRNQTNFQKIFENYTFINYELIPGIFVETNTRVTTKTTNTKTSKIQSPNKYINNRDEISNEKKIKKNKNDLYNNNFVILNQRNKNNEFKEKEELSIDKNNIIKTHRSPNKKQLNLDNMDLDANIKYEKGKEDNKENKEILFSNKSLFKNINNIFNNIKKLASSTNKIITNSRSASVDMSNSNLKNNLSQNIAYVKYRKKEKEINMNYINNNLKNINDFNNMPLSNPNRNKPSYKLHKNNSDFAYSLKTNRNKNTNKSVKEISIVNLGDNNNNYINVKKSNYIQLRKINEVKRFPFYLPNLNKESNFNIRRFKPKLKLNLDKTKSPRNTYNIYNNNNFNSKNLKLFSPPNKRMKKSESGFFMKTPMNSSVYNLNQNLSINLKDIGDIDNNNNLYSTYLKKKYGNFSNKVFHKRKKSGKK